MPNLLPVALIEDNEDDLFFMQRAFKAAGIVHPLQILKNGRQAINYLAGLGPYADRALHPLPCLLLMDLQLPGVSGFEILEWVRSHQSLSDLVVVILTTSGEDRDIRTAYRLGANAYLVKPSGSENRLNQMKALRDFWLNHCLLPRNS